MKILYLLDRPEIGGGVKVVFQHAELLREHGHEVTILGKGRVPRWVCFGGDYLNYDRRLPVLPSHDLAIATFWTTFSLADALGCRSLAHFCQGYEGDSAHLKQDHSKIEEVYRRKLPTLVVSPHLAERLSANFGRACALTPPPVDPIFRPHRRTAPERKPWIALCGIYEFDLKGIPSGLEAIRLLRDRGHACRVLRISVLPLSAAEKGELKPDRYLWRVGPDRVARALRRCDLLLFTSLPQEGFGLPLLEAMASGVPAVASRIPSTEFMSGGAVALVPPADPAAVAEAAERLLSDPISWRRASAAGLVAAGRFAPEIVGQTLCRAVEWAHARIERFD